MKAETPRVPKTSGKTVGKGTGLGLSISYGIVKDHGGRTIVQKPSNAKAPEMPRAAIAAGAADQVLSLQGIAKIIGNFG